MYAPVLPFGRALGHQAGSAAAGPVDPTLDRNMHYQACNSSWIFAAGTTGAGVAADVSLNPTEQTRLIGRFYGNDVWAALNGCVGLPYLTDDEYQSIYQQFVCHLEGGLTTGDTGPTFDFEAWRPVVPAFDSLLDYHCNPPDPRGGQEYVNQIVQWAADPNAQKTAWLITPTSSGMLQREWIPTSEIYYCLKNAGYAGPTELDHDFFVSYLDPRGPDVTQSGACGSSGPPNPVASGDFYVQNADGGIYWRSRADWNTPEATAGNGFYPGTVIRPTCYQSGAADVPGSADAMWEQATWVSGPGSGSGWINEHYVADGQPINQPSPGVPSCSPPPPPPTWSEQETPNHPVNTFTDYHNASGMGQPIAAGQWVQVSCKVYDPTIASVNPDGYWYRVASSPWNNTYYSPANTFMNGDPYGGPYTHNTDFNVPDC